MLPIPPPECWRADKGTDIGTRFSLAGPITATEAVGFARLASICCARRALAPNAFSVSNFNFVVADIEIYRFVRFSFNDNEVISANFNLAAKITADVGAGDHRNRVDSRIDGSDRSTAGAKST